MVNAPIDRPGARHQGDRDEGRRPRLRELHHRAGQGHGATDRLIEGAIFHGNQPRIVRIDDFMLEAIPEGPTLLLHNHDQAGVVGTVGTSSARKASTSRACSSRWFPSGSEAAMLVNVDTPGEECAGSLAQRCRT